MKKKICFLLSSLCLFMTTACTEEKKSSNSSKNDSSSSSTIPIPPVDVLNLYEDSFNVKTLIKTTEDNSTLTQNSEVFVGKDYYTFKSYVSDTDEVSRALYFEKGSENEVVRKTIDKTNTIVSSSNSTELWKNSIYYNPISYFDLEIIDEGEYNLIDHATLKVIQNFNNLLSGQLTGTLEPQIAKFTLENTNLSYFSSYSSNGITLTIESDFINKDDEVINKIAVYPETEDSKQLDSWFERLKQNNYTVEIAQNDTLLETIFVNPEQIYSRNSDENVGYTKTEEGYNNLSVNSNESIVSLTSQSENSFQTLLADFNISGKVFNRNETNLKPYVDVINIIDAFNLVRAKNYISSSGLTISYNEESLTLNSSDIMSSTSYTVSFKNIGNTIIPVDLYSFSSKDSWQSENEEIAQNMVELIGSSELIPYLNTGYNWDILDYVSGEYLEIYSEGGTDPEDVLTEEQSAQFKKEYATLFQQKGFRKMTAEEIETLDWYYCTEPEMQEVYDLNNGYCCEIVNNYVDSGAVGISLYIQKIVIE